MKATYIIRLALLAVLVGPKLYAQGPQGEKIQERATFLPFQKYEPIPAKAIGILIAEPAQILAQEGRSGPPDHICFARGPGSYRWMYMITQGDALITDLQVPAGLKGEITQCYPALVMANPASIRPFGMFKKFTLVEAEVNQGQGSPAYQSFVATNLKVVEGTKEFPMPVTDMVALAQKEHAVWLRAQAKEINQALTKVTDQVMKGKASAKRETTQSFYVTWLPETERVCVRFGTKITGGDYKEIGAGGAVPRPNDSPRPRIKAGTEFGVEFGRGYQISKEGTLMQTELLALETFIRELPLPPAVPGPRPGRPGFGK